jgi:hypothetical protein
MVLGRAATSLMLRADFKLLDITAINLLKLQKIIWPHSIAVTPPTGADYGRA